MAARAPPYTITFWLDSFNDDPAGILSSFVVDDVSCACTANNLSLPGIGIAGDPNPPDEPQFPFLPALSLPGVVISLLALGAVTLLLAARGQA